MIKKLFYKAARLKRKQIESELISVGERTVYAVSGFPRSGSSLLCKLLSRTGVYFGESADLRKGDTSNPEGYYENKKITSVNIQLLSQVGEGKQQPEHSLRAKGVLNTLKRGRTRARMITVVNDFNARANEWGFKMTPARLPRFTFHFWGKYLPNMRLVAVFRHPVAAAHSYVKMKEDEPVFVEALEQWTRYHKQLIYYLSRYKGVLVSYEDLISPDLRRRTVKNLLSSIGKYTAGNEQLLLGDIRPELSHSDKEVAGAVEMFPLSQETKDVLSVLHKIKI